MSSSATTVLVTKKPFFNRRLTSLLKLLLIIGVFSLYFLILLRASIASMEDGRCKTIKFEQSNKIHRKNNDDESTSSLDVMRNKNNDNKIIKKKKSSHHFIHKKNNNGKNLHVEASTHKTTSTVNPIYEYSEELNTAAENEFNQRKQRLWDTCIKRKIIGKYPPNAWEFFISPGHGVTWCNVFKAASSTWMYYFNILGGFNNTFLQRTRESPIELARQRFPRPNLSELSEALSNSISFLIVREPFERLLSAYKNKLEGYHNKYYRLLGRQIVKKFRTTTTDSIKKKPFGPTFKEFLLYLTNHKSGARFDEHWTPIYTFCTPCSINFTLIAKMETFQRDTEYIIRQAGLETLLLNKLPKNKKSISNRSKSDTKSLIAKYFSQIDKNLLEDLLKIYELDFALFGYNSTKYFDFVQPSTSSPLTTIAINSTGT